MPKWQVSPDIKAFGPREEKEGFMPSATPAIAATEQTSSATTSGETPTKKDPVFFGQKSPESETKGPVVPADGWEEKCTWLLVPAMSW